LYRGFVVSCVCIFIYRGLYFGLFDSLKPILLGDNASWLHTFLLGWGVTITSGLVINIVLSFYLSVCLSVCIFICLYFGLFDSLKPILLGDNATWLHTFMLGWGVTLTSGLVTAIVLLVSLFVCLYLCLSVSLPVSLLWAVRFPQADSAGR
jgi:hypothetical protein